METTAFFSSNPLFAPKLKVEEIMLEGYRDAGKKNPEEFVQTGQSELPPEVQQKLMMAQQEMQKMGQLIQQLQAQLKSEKDWNSIKIVKIESDLKQAQAKLMEQKDEFQKTMLLEIAKLQMQKPESQSGTMVAINAGDEIGKVAKSLQDMSVEHGGALKDAADVISKAAERLSQSAEKMASKKKKTIQRTNNGYVVQDES